MSKSQRLIVLRTSVYTCWNLEIWHEVSITSCIREGVNAHSLSRTNGPLGSWMFKSFIDDVNFVCGIGIDLMEPLILSSFS